MVARTLVGAAMLLLTQSPSADSPGGGLHFGVGHAPTEDELNSLSIMVTTDGSGLPAGSGTALKGKEVFATRCASCHGPTGDGGNGPPLVGGQGTLATPKPRRTVGSYWPYATTLWDYVNRAMPFNRPGTLTHEEVYAVSAYVLFLNGLIAENDQLNAQTLPLIQMPNRDGFIADPRPDMKTEASSMSHE